MIKKYPILEEKCTGCCSCYNICPNNSINMIENEEGFLYPVINKATCIECELCKKVCPELNKQEDNEQKFLKSYYGWHKNQNTRLNSSSGGFFSALAELIISQNGIVFGAAYFNDIKEVKHSSTIEVKIERLKKSKYVQSSIGSIFNEVQDQLIDNKLTLFSGTPCQVDGLKRYLGKDYNNLITVDFICHGVPSPSLLKKHIEWIENRIKKTIIDLDFRPKDRGWDKHSLGCKDLSSKWWFFPAEDDPYFKAFFCNYSLRKSCYECNYSVNKHLSDITMGDFWGYYRYNSSIYDKRGLSLILVNTEKGYNYINKISSFEKYEIENKYSEYVFQKRSPLDYGYNDRNEFFKYLNSYGWDKTIKRYNLLPNTYLRAKRFFIKIMKKLGV